MLHRLALKETSVAGAVRDGQRRIEGDAGKVAELFDPLDDFQMIFDVVEPGPRS
jgi:alkyl sulfatase BDS1-like metallo-beta-lactamase superfamily hydrolase